MATVPPPDSIPETPAQPSGMPGEASPPPPDTDVPDPGDPNHPDSLEAEAHPS